MKMNIKTNILSMRDIINLSGRDLYKKISGKEADPNKDYNWNQEIYYILSGQELITEDCCSSFTDDEWNYCPYCGREIERNSFYATGEDIDELSKELDGGYDRKNIKNELLKDSTKKEVDSGRVYKFLSCDLVLECCSEYVLNIDNKIKNGG